jgi:hypothetical protein
MKNSPQLKAAAFAIFLILAIMTLAFVGGSLYGGVVIGSKDADDSEPVVTSTYRKNDGTAFPASSRSNPPASSTTPTQPVQQPQPTMRNIGAREPATAPPTNSGASDMQLGFVDDMTNQALGAMGAPAQNFGSLSQGGKQMSVVNDFKEWLLAPATLLQALKQL